MSACVMDSNEDDSTLPSFSASLDAIVVLHIQGGGDLYITVCASYVRSSFGRPLEALAALGPKPALEKLPPSLALTLRMPLLPLEEPRGGAAIAAAARAAIAAEEGPYLAYDADKGTEGLGAEAGARRRPRRAEGEPPPPFDPRSPVPKEVLRLTEYLLSGKRLQEPGLFVRSVPLLVEAFQRHTGHSPATSSSNSAFGSGAAAVAAGSAVTGISGAAGGEQQPEAQHVLLLRAVAPIRAALDAWRPFPLGTGPHHIAAALLALLHHLPGGLLPDNLLDISGGVATLCAMAARYGDGDGGVGEVGAFGTSVAPVVANPAPGSPQGKTVPPRSPARGAAAAAAPPGAAPPSSPLAPSLDTGSRAVSAVARCVRTGLKEQRSATDYAVLQHVLGVMRWLTEPLNAQRNGVDVPALAAATAPFLFAAPTPTQAAAEPPERAAARRGLLLALLLDGRV